MNCKLPSKIFGESCDNEYSYAIKISGVRKYLTFQTLEDRNWFYVILKERNPVDIWKLVANNGKWVTG